MKERQRNTKLSALIQEANWAHAQVVIAFSRVALERGATEFGSIGRSHVSKWVAGYAPSGSAPSILAEMFTRRLRRTVTPDEIGLTGLSSPQGIDWDADTLSALVDLGRGTLDVERRSLLRAAGYSVAALSLPDDAWWEKVGLGRSPGSARDSSALVIWKPFVRPSSCSLASISAVAAGTPEPLSCST